MLVSFVIPHQGRVDMLLETVASIAAQDFDLSDVEVWVMTQNPEGSLVDLATAFPQLVNLAYCAPDHTISALRNQGVSVGTGEYVAFLDADIALSQNWLATMLGLINTAGNSRAIVSAVQKESADAPPLEIIRTEISNAKTDCNVDFLPGRNLFMRRETFDKIGGFPEHLVTCEDYYFTDKATAYGALFYSAEASYIHLGEDKDFANMFKKEIWRGQSNLASIKGRRVPVSEIPSFLSPIWVTLFCVLALILVLLAKWQCAAVSAIIGLLPLLVYALRLTIIANGRVSFYHACKFYVFYFPARTYGTFVGLFKSIQFQN